MFLLVISTLIFINTNAQRIRESSCKDSCRTTKVQCMSSCKRGFLRRLSKQNFLRCFEKCSKSAGACYPRCDCMALVERERKGCDRACDSYPFTSSFDISHCYKECKFDYEAGQKICEAGTMFLHRDLETTISWVTFLHSFPNLIRVGKNIYSVFPLLFQSNL